MISFIWLLLCIVAPVVVFSRRCNHVPGTAIPLPPGPPRDRFLGNLRLLLRRARELELPARAETFHKWAQLYGDVMYLEGLGRKLLILDSIQSMNDLLDKRNAIYSGRPEMATFNLLGWKDFLGFLPPGKAFNTQKGMIRRFFGRQDCLAFEQVQTRTAAEMVSLLWQSRTKHEKSCALQWYMISVTSQILYGRKVSAEGANLFDNFMEVLIELDTVFTNFFPQYAYFLEWVPWYRRIIQKGRSITKQIVHTTFEEALCGMETNPAVESSFVGINMQNLPSSEDGNFSAVEHLKKASAMCMAASSDPMHGTLLVFIYVMILHPHCFAKAQQEIDAAIGYDRLPSLQDKERLPYLLSVIQETLRWMPVVPMGVPHMSTEDDLYRGMFIPKGTVIIPNIRGLSLDENVYKDATRFYPERFLPKDQGGREEPFDSLHIFGFGRRKCPGRYLAENSLWLAVSFILATCDVSMFRTDSGKPIVPQMSFTENLAALILKPFQFEISPRLAKSKVLIEGAVSVA